MKNKSFILLSTGLVTVVLGFLIFKQSLSSTPTTPQTPTTREAPAETSQETSQERNSIEQESKVMGEETSETTLTISNFSYSPQNLTVKPGETIKVTNLDTAGHNVASDDGVFKTKLLYQGESTTFTAPTEPGTYPYHCTPHPFMQASIIVEE